jgi:hypothetical protein
MAIGAHVSVAGIVVAEPGRLGTPALIAIADDTAGIAVRLPSGATGPARGTLVQVSGTLAAPYGQLEIRTESDGVESTGSAALPLPVAVAPDGLDEPDEGRLVTTTGTVAGKPKRSSGGDLTIVLERPGAASIRLLADASSQLSGDAFTVGATYRVVGVVGQRASKKGALDGYRICLRDAADVVVTLGAAGAATGAPETGVPETEATGSIAAPPSGSRSRCAGSTRPSPSTRS